MASLNVFESEQYFFVISSEHFAPLAVLMPMCNL
jgi:hypothetical protein